MYTVYGRVNTRTFRVLWMLEELGAPYAHVPAAPQSDQIRVVSPPGKIPVLTVNGATLTDSVAILTYLADHHGTLTFPAGTLDRARQDGMTQRIVDEFDAVLWAATRHRSTLPEEHRVPAVVPSLAWEFGQNLERLAGAFKGPFLLGETMTVPDIVFGHCLGWAMVAKFRIESDALLEYFRGLRGRDAYTRVMAMVRPA